MIGNARATIDDDEFHLIPCLQGFDRPARPLAEQQVAFEVPRGALPITGLPVLGPL